MIIKKVINGKEKEFDLDISRNGFIYDGNEYMAHDDRYVVIGVHNDNPGCYKYLDMVIVYDTETDGYKLVRAWDVLGDSYHNESSKLNSVTYEDGNFVIKSCAKTAYVFPQLIMAEDIKPNTVVSPILDITKMETCFDYEVMEDMAILMTLKEEVPMTQFLKWHGFNMDYNAFKFWGSILSGGQSYLMFVNTKTGNSWTVSYGHSTTMTSGEIWQRRDVLIDCIKKVLPSHPQVREYCYFSTK